jgi:hypothetical protein
MAAHESEPITMEEIEESMFNRTGIMINPEMSAEMIQGAKAMQPSPGDISDLAAERLDYISEGIPIGSYPPMTDGKKETEDGKLAVLLDKLGERLAFERQGTRLYQTFIQKLEAMPDEDENGPTPDELRHICDEELEHFKLLQKAIADLGGDATVQTPAADVAGVLSHGAVKVVGDPRTTIAQSLQALLVAELADNDGWHMLQQLAGELGHNELEKQCERALEQEQEHLANVRSWVTAMTMGEAMAFERLGKTDETSSLGEHEEDEDKETGESPARSSSRSRAKAKSTGRKKKRR